MDEPRITLTTFMRFLVANHGQRIRVVAEALAMYRGEYEPSHDYWRGFRNAFDGVTSGPGLLAALDKTIREAPDHKVDNYRAGRDGVKKWLGRKKLEAMPAPRKAVWREGTLTVHLNPNLVVRVNGQPYAIKLWTRGEPLGKVRLNGVLYLLEWGFASQGFRVGVLDARRGRLIEPTVQVSNIEDYLASEAAAFVTLWNRLGRPGGHLRVV